MDVQKAWRSSRLDDLQTLKAVPKKSSRGADCDPRVVIHVDVGDIGLPVSEGGVTIDDQLESCMIVVVVFRNRGEVEKASIQTLHSSASFRSIH